VNAEELVAAQRHRCHRHEANHTTRQVHCEDPRSAARKAPGGYITNGTSQPYSRGRGEGGPEAPPTRTTGPGRQKLAPGKAQRGWAGEASRCVGAAIMPLVRQQAHVPGRTGRESCDAFAGARALFVLPIVLPWPNEPVAR
jgi:hypothetical protein